MMRDVRTMQISRFSLTVQLHQSNVSQGSNSLQCSTSAQIIPTNYPLSSLQQQVQICIFISDSAASKIQKIQYKKGC